MGISIITIYMSVDYKQKYLKYKKKYISLKEQMGGFGKCKKDSQPVRDKSYVPRIGGYPHGIYIEKPLMGVADTKIPGVSGCPRIIYEDKVRALNVDKKKGLEKMRKEIENYK